MILNTYMWITELPTLNTNEAATDGRGSSTVESHNIIARLYQSTLFNRMCWRVSTKLTSSNYLCTLQATQYSYSVGTYSKANSLPIHVSSKTIYVLICLFICPFLYLYINSHISLFLVFYLCLFCKYINMFMLIFQWIKCYYHLDSTHWPLHNKKKTLQAFLYIM